MPTEIMKKIQGNMIKLSQSRLKFLLGTDPSLFYKDRPKKEIYAFVKGNYFEDLLLNPGIIDKKYYEIDSKKETVNKCHKVINKFFEKDLSKLEPIKDIQSQADALIELMDEFEYYTASTNEVRLNKLEAVAGEYWSLMIEYRIMKKQGFQIIAKEDVEVIKEISAAILSHKIIKDYLPPYKKGIEVVIQKEIEFKYLGENCIAILDLYIVDHNKKEIQIIDIKFTERNPRKAALDLRWDIQGSFYNYAVFYNNKELVSKGYQIMRPLFLVGRYNAPSQPMLFEMSQKEVITGHTGCTKYSNLELMDAKDEIINYSRPYSIEGFHQLIERYQWHKETKKWEFRKEFYENMGLEELNLF